MFITKTRLSFFAFLTDPAGAGAAFKSRLWLSAPTDQKIGSGSGAALKIEAPAPQH